jgi:hypothetical protein
MKMSPNLADQGSLRLGQQCARQLEQLEQTSSTHLRADRSYSPACKGIHLESSCASIRLNRTLLGIIPARICLASASPTLLDEAREEKTQKQRLSLEAVLGAENRWLSVKNLGKQLQRPLSTDPHLPSELPFPDR